MALRDRYVVFDGVNLRTEYGLQYSSFEEELPEPKVVKVEIPAGIDLDITDSLGVLGWHNGRHVMRFLLYGDTEADRLDIKREIINRLHGRMVDYKLSWDSDYTYTGRVKVGIEHLFENADVLTIEVDRNPWKVAERESVDINSHPSGSYTMTGSSRYHFVRALMLQGGTTKIGSDAAVTRPYAGDYPLADDVYGDTAVTITVSDWLFYVTSGGNMVVNSTYYSIDGSDVAIDDSYTVTNGNMVFELEPKQHAILSYTRYDL